MGGNGFGVYNLWTGPRFHAVSKTTESSNFNQAIATLNYYFRVTGPTNLDLKLPIWISGSISSTPNVNRPFDQSFARNYLEVLACGTVSNTGVCQNTPDAFSLSSL